MSQVIFTIHFIILFFVASLHIYWVLGGKMGSFAVLPQTSSKEPIFMPSKLITFLVAIAFYIAAFVFGHSAGFFHFSILSNYQTALLIFIAIVFLIRAVGDFKYVGFAKKMKGTPFATNDSKYYSPLCFMISITIFLAIYFQ